MMPTRFDVGGYELAAAVTGAGQPPVVFVSGLGGAGESWQPTIAHLGSMVTTMTYARAGIGESDALPGPAVRSFGAAADELRTLLASVQVDQPCVLVGHSIGALIAQIYVSRWPGEVAGLVLVDPSDAELYLDIGEPRAIIADSDGGRSDHASFDVRSGVAELAGSRRPLSQPAIVITSRVGRWLDSKTPHLWRPFGLAELDARWQAYHRDLVADLGAVHRVATVGGHHVQRDEPTLVADCIDQVVARIERRPLIVSAAWLAGMGPGGWLNALAQANEDFVEDAAWVDWWQTIESNDRVVAIMYIEDRAKRTHRASRSDKGLSISVGVPVADALGASDLRAFLRQHQFDMWHDAARKLEWSEPPGHVPQG